MRVVGAWGRLLYITQNFNSNSADDQGLVFVSPLWFAHHAHHLQLDPVPFGKLKKQSGTPVEGWGVEQFNGESSTIDIHGTEYEKSNDQVE